MTESGSLRVALIVAVALGAHLTALAIQWTSRTILLRAHVRSETKILTITGFATSVLLFGIYFGAFGFVLSELGVSLTTYLASASVIGLAVSFGSQGVVQDVITGLTLVFTDLLDVGDMVDLGGQTGIVESIGMRFTVLVNFAGARVFVPNRSIATLVSYPNGYTRAFLDARLPDDPDKRDEGERRLKEIAQSAYEQYTGILLIPPTVEGRIATSAGFVYLRIRFRIWPGQGAVIEGAVKAAAVQTLKALDATYADWMVTIHYRAESADRDAARRLPRPSALRARERRLAARESGPEKPKER